MQVKKKELKHTIIAVAREEFIRNGVKKTSMRTIAKHSGMALGNIYKYFKGKDELFRTVLSPLIKALDEYMLDHNSQENITTDIFSMQQRHRKVTDDLLKMIKKYRAELRLLLFDTANTSLERYREDLAHRQTLTGMEYLHLMKAKYPHLNIDISPFFMHITCLIWVTVIAELIAHEELNDATIERFLSEYMEYGMAGWKQLMKV